MESLTGKIVEKDDTIPELPPKDLVRLSNWPSLKKQRVLMTFRFSEYTEMFDSALTQRHIRFETLILTVCRL